MFLSLTVTDLFPHSFKWFISHCQQTERQIGLFLRDKVFFLFNTTANLNQIRWHIFRRCITIRNFSKSINWQHCHCIVGSYKTWSLNIFIRQLNQGCLFVDYVSETNFSIIASSVFCSKIIHYFTQEFLKVPSI
jgi:hypothetical protein